MPVPCLYHENNFGESFSLEYHEKSNAIVIRGYCCQSFILDRRYMKSIADFFEHYFTKYNILTIKVETSDMDSTLLKLFRELAEKHDFDRKSKQFTIYFDRSNEIFIEIFGQTFLEMGYIIKVPDENSNLN